MKTVAALAAAAFLLVPVAAHPAGGAPVVIAVVDSGVNASDPELRPLLVPGRNVFDDSVDTRDQSGHGTGVALVIASVIGDRCDRCRIMPVKIAGPDGSTSQGTVAAGIRWATEHGARVVNLSWGAAVGARSTHAVEAAVADAAENGTTVTMAALNDGSSDPSVNVWAAFSTEGIRVAAVDNDGELRPSSNHGPWVEIGAPAGATSSAAPRVAAAAALMIQVRAGLGAREVKAGLRRSCRQVAGLALAWHCVLDTDAAVAAADSVPPQTFRLVVERRGGGDGRVGDGGAIDCGLFCTDRLDVGTKVTLRATAAAGSVFAGWQGDCSGAGPTCALTVSADTGIAAVFARRRVTLSVRRIGSGTVTSAPAGIACGKRCAARMIPGPVTLTARAAPGHRFSRWQGACRGTRPTCVVVLAKPATAIAVFAPTAP